jgi:hypothetical protein
MEASIRPVNFGYIVDVYEDDDHSEFVCITRKEALDFVNSLLHDYDQRVNLQSLVTEKVDGT